ncbi:cell wall / vacuolar inhibitor of fructosidase 1-like [Mercurialis annua]|uniref:cell wall / vacuolar inhibitor of fructosidase 1-like n=1 Tax=Mercurialis annua TaxID=3986 RepID=UPI00215EC1E7|nr:cell wall / vacuolar inhibitor of fructosidase 1-like [Mercurialis annua]
MKKFSILLLLLLILIRQQISHASDSDLIDQICKKTPFYDLCISSLTPQNPIPDVKTVASTMANLVLSNATDTLTFIQELIKQGADPQLQKKLANCAELYIPVVKYNLPQAMNALFRGKFGFTSYLLSDAGKQADACQKNFSDSDEAPLSERNKLITHLCDVAVAILKLLS